MNASKSSNEWEIVRGTEEMDKQRSLDKVALER